MPNKRIEFVGISKIGNHDRSCKFCLVFEVQKSKMVMIDWNVVMEEPKCKKNEVFGMVKQYENLIMKNYSNVVTRLGE